MIESVKKELREIMEKVKTIKDAPPEKRAELGAKYNKRKKELEEKLAALQKEEAEKAANEKLLADKLIDITIPEIGAPRGGLHPISIIVREVEEVFASMGFIIEDGPEIATDYENFESVNIPKNHPARDMQDTFWLSDGRCLRTQTSAYQNYIIKKYGPEFRVICPGRTYRNENLDATHDTTFFQVEGMMVGKDISISNLVYFMKQALTAVFKKEINVRLRPGFFPFVEPGFELDASCIFCEDGCPLCKHSKWIEFCGCGMIHPNVLKEGGLDPKKYQGFAFGFGLTRLAMMRWGIKDIRLFNGGNLEFLQGGFK
jgi:phenylalanyl-tRNA synthetase alpha chain